MIPNKKSSILLVLKVLEEYTDDEHYLTQSQIVEKIEQLYDIELERKSVGSSLGLLEELDYDIIKGSKGGFALLSRTFDSTEVSYLIDAVFSSRSIDGREAKRMSDEVSSCLSKYQRKDYSYIYKSSEVNRTSNRDALYNVSVIHEAIKSGKKISFQYLSYDKKGNPIARREGYEFVVSPYYLINNFGRYYLICNYREKYGPIQTFRIDYMMNIKIKDDEEIKRLDEIENAPKNFSITKYMNDHIYIFGGETIDVTLELDGEWVILYIKDWFGESARIYTKDDKVFASVRCNENAIYYWIMQYSDCVKVISPSKLVERIKEGLQRAISKY